MTLAAYQNLKAYQTEKLDQLRAVVSDFLRGDPSTKIYRYQYEDVLQNVDLDDAIGVENWEKVLDANSAYYLFKNDIDIINRHAGDIAACANYSATVIELAIGGAKAIACKTLPMIAALKPQRFIANDISQSAIDMAEHMVGQRFPGLQFEGAVSDYYDLSAPLYRHTNATVIFAGSSISNITSEDGGIPVTEVVHFLKTIAKLVGPKGSLIITQDTNQDEDSLLAAYHTPGFAAFRLGTLHRIQKALNINGLDPTAFRAQSFWHPERYLVANTLVCTRAQTVRLGDEIIHIPEGQKLYISNSHRYPADCFLEMCKQAGLTSTGIFFDQDQRLATHVLVHKS
jgi:uncharacterized SAM-dependent methyltransferase